jgi:hypothetical protein
LVQENTIELVEYDDYQQACVVLSSTTHHEEENSGVELVGKSTRSLSHPMIEPAIDYETSELPAAKLLAIQSSSSSSSSSLNSQLNSMSTFNQKSNLIMMINPAVNQQPSPLTPRQIKQRNSAKRNSIPRSISSNPSIVQQQQQQQIYHYSNNSTQETTSSIVQSGVKKVHFLMVFYI